MAIGKVRCPGSLKTTVPTPIERKCPKCGRLVEIWSDEDVGTCTECGTEWKRPDNNNSCLNYCEYAEKCEGLIESRKT